jgi:hypothetical protein
MSTVARFVTACSEADLVRLFHAFVIEQTLVLPEHPGLRVGQRSTLSIVSTAGVPLLRGTGITTERIESAKGAQVSRGVRFDLREIDQASSKTFEHLQSVSRRYHKITGTSKVPPLDRLAHVLRASTRHVTSAAWPSVPVSGARVAPPPPKPAPPPLVPAGKALPAPAFRREASVPAIEVTVRKRPLPRARPRMGAVFTCAVITCGVGFFGYGAAQSLSVPALPLVAALAPVAPTPPPPPATDADVPALVAPPAVTTAPKDVVAVAKRRAGRTRHHASAEGHRRLRSRRR